MMKAIVHSILLLVGLLMNSYQEAQAQAFNINTFFNGPQYAFYSADSNNFLQDESYTEPLLEQHIHDMCKLPTGSFYHALDKITYSGNRTFLNGLHDQVPEYDTIFKECKLDFVYGGISSSTYSFFVNGLNDTNTAFLVMPGSGSFQSLFIAEGNSDNYHNQSCIVKEMLRQKGDVYVYVRPNEEFRSIWINRYGTGYYPKLDYDVLDPYTKFHGIDWQDNLFSEINVWVHYLKKKYKRVVIMGLSAGGWPPLFSSLQLKPDACIIASGFSAASYQNFIVTNNENTVLDGVLGVYTMDSLRTIVRHSNTEYLFSYGDQEVDGNLYEYQSHALQDSLQTPSQASNINFSYFSGVHTFHCPSIDTFLDRVLNKPKTFIKLLDDVCTTDSVQVKINFAGHAPYVFNLYKDSSFVSSYSSSVDSTMITLTQGGTYQVRDLYDAGPEIGYNSDLFTYSKDSAVTLSVSSTYFNCDSNKAAMNLQLQGNTPWLFTYSFNGLNHTDTIHSANKSYLFPNGELQFMQLSTLNACSLNLNQHYIFSDSQVNINVLAPEYSCDSNKTKIHLNLAGKAPWILQYIYNGALVNRPVANQMTDLYFDNGQYYFIKVTDSNNCSKSINQGFLFNTLPLNITSTVPYYNCDSNKTFMQFQCQGNQPWILHYSKDAVNQTLMSGNSTFNTYLEEGTYDFQYLTDASGCQQSLNQSYTFGYQAINAVFSPLEYDCDSLKAKIHFELEGNPPWIIHYTKNSIPMQWVTYQAIGDQYFSNGLYYFSAIIDATNCLKSINTSVNINYSPIQVTHTSPVYECSTNQTNIAFHFGGNGPFTLSFSKNSNPISILCFSPDTTLSFDNGMYHFNSVADITGCSVPMTDAFTFNNDTLELAVGTPSYSCDSNKTKIHFDLEGNPPFTIYYYHNLQSQQLVTSQTSFDVYFTDGNYFFYKLKDNKNCIIDTNLIYTFNFQPVTGVITQQGYNCDSNKYQVDFLFTGSTLWHLEYTDGSNVYVKTTSSPNMSLYLNNGSWIINKVTNDAGCVEYFNLPLSLTFNPLSASIVNQQYDCDSNKLKISFALTGNAPWTIHYVKNGAVPVYLNDITSNPNHALYLSNGSYSFLDVKDNTNCNVTSLFQSVWNNYSNLGVSETARSFSCDSNKVKVDYTLTGDGPWTLYYNNSVTGTVYSVSSANPSMSLYLNSGHYSLLSVTDSKCSISLQDTLLINFEILGAVITPASVSCDSTQYFIKFIAHGGRKPYNYEYYFNGALFTMSSMTDTTVLYLPNGNYLFTRLTDSVGCIIQFNQNLSVTYSDFTFNSVSSSYLCAANSTQLTFDVTHQQPVWLVYMKNTTLDTLLLLNSSGVSGFSNGNYDFLFLYDAEGCHHNINQQLIINNTPVTYTPIVVNTDCTNKKYVYTSTLGGKAPWHMVYNHNNLPDTLLVSNSSLHWITVPGTYYLADIRDSNNCTVMISRSDTLYNFMSQSPVLQKSGNQLQVQPLGYKYYWYKNLVLVDSTAGNSLTTLDDGNYYAMVKDLAGCLYPTNSIKVSYPVDVDVYQTKSEIKVYPNPIQSISTVMVNDTYGSFWNYVIMDMKGHKLLSGVEHTSIKEFDFRSFASGVYSLIITYQQDTSKHFIRLIKE